MKLILEILAVIVVWSLTLQFLWVLVDIKHALRDIASILRSKKP